MHGICSLLAAGFLGGLVGCTPRQPLHLALQDTWTEDERTHILSDMARWEQATSHIIQFMPSPVPFHDPSGEFERSDLDDGASVLYKVERENKDTDWLMSAAGVDLAGYNFDSDMLIFWYKLGIVAGPNESLELFDPLVLHELGHHTGLGHIRIHPSIMNDGYTTDCITQWDLEAFCELYGCQLGDMHPECLVAP